MYTYIISNKVVVKLGQVRAVSVSPTFTSNTTLELRYIYLTQRTTKLHCNKLSRSNISTCSKVVQVNYKSKQQSHYYIIGSYMYISLHKLSCFYYCIFQGNLKTQHPDSLFYVHVGP